jgi:hypothetical protein
VSVHRHSITQEWLVYIGGRRTYIKCKTEEEARALSRIRLEVGDKDLMAIKRECCKADFMEFMVPFVFFAIGFISDRYTIVALCLAAIWCLIPIVNNLVFARIYVKAVSENVKVSLKPPELLIDIYSGKVNKVPVPLLLVQYYFKYIVLLLVVVSAFWWR